MVDNKSETQPQLVVEKNTNNLTYTTMYPPHAAECVMKYDSRVKKEVPNGAVANWVIIREGVGGGRRDYTGGS